KISGTAESDGKWYYFSSTLARKWCHMHCIQIDRIRKKVLVTNGDNEDYIWSIDIASLNSWYDSATVVNPDVFPVYQTSDTYPDWHSVKIKPFATSVCSFAWYTNFAPQTVQFYPIGAGLILGHD